MLDAQHNIWVGTNGGLFKIQGSNQKVQYFSTRNGLPSNVVHSLVQAAKGVFWIATNEGICRFNETKKSVRTYKLHDELSGKEFISNASALLLLLLLSVIFPRMLVFWAKEPRPIPKKSNKIL